MKQTRPILLLTVSALCLTGCASGPLGRLLTTGAAAGGGAALAHSLSHGDPALTALGAVGGVALGEGINYLQTKAESKAYTAGYDQGRSDAAKAQYWLQQRQQAPQRESLLLYPVPVPAQEIDGVNYQATTHYIPLPR